MIRPSVSYQQEQNRRRCFQQLDRAETFRGTHGNSTNNAVTQLLLNFKRKLLSSTTGVIHAGYAVTWKFHVDNGTDNLYDFPLLISVPLY